MLQKGTNHPAELVQSMSEEDVWLTIKKLGTHDGISVLAKTTKDQLQYILDIELWRRDKFMPEQALEWLSLLKECGDEKIIQWVHETDIDAVVLAFKEFVIVQKKESQDDDPMEKEWPGPFPPSTMDGVYWFQCLAEASDPVIRPILESIARNDHMFFMQLCEAVMAELKSNLVESAFSWRTKRLVEKGFAPIEEAIEVYKFFNEHQIKTLPKRGATVFKETPPKKPQLLAIGGEFYPTLTLAMAALKDNPLIGDIALEMATLANKVLMADGRLIMPETVESSLKKVMGYINIGLEHLSGADPHKAGQTLCERWCLHLFQTGFSLIARLRQNARKFIAAGYDISLLDETSACKIEGILRKRPLYFDHDFKDFKDINEVRDVQQELERALYLGRMFKDVFKLTPNEIKDATGENMRFDQVLTTIWAKGTATNNYKFAPLTEKELKTLLKKGLSRDFSKWLIERQPNISTEEEKYCRAFIEDCLRKFSDEFSGFSKGDKIDWRFVQTVWIVPRAD